MDKFYVVRKGQQSPVYVAWPTTEGFVPGVSGFAFTVNDGRVPGKVTTLSTEEFWRVFDRTVQK